MQRYRADSRLEGMPRGARKVNTSNFTQSGNRISGMRCYRRARPLAKASRKSRADRRLFPFHHRPADAIRDNGICFHYRRPAAYLRLDTEPQYAGARDGGTGYLIAAAGAATLATPNSIPNAWAVCVGNALICGAYGAMWSGALLGVTFLRVSSDRRPKPARGFSTTYVWLCCDSVWRSRKVAAFGLNGLPPDGTGALAGL